MRDPLNQNKVIVTGEEYEVLVIQNLPEYEFEDYDLFSDKDKKKYIQDLEKSCRNSYEYKTLVNYLRDNIDMNKCSFYKNVSNIDTYKIKIHIHHEPFTLGDICIIVYNKRAANNESLEVELVAKEVMYLHYMLLVGLIPLAETPHQLVHNGYLFVPADAVLGRYKNFINLYEEYMEPEQLYVLDNILEATKYYNGEDTNILEKKLIYIDTSGAYKLPSAEEIKILMESKLQEIESSTNDIFDLPSNTNIKVEPVFVPFTDINKEEN